MALHLPATNRQFFFFFDSENEMKLWIQHYCQEFNALKCYPCKWPLGYHSQQRGQGHHSEDIKKHIRTFSSNITGYFAAWGGGGDDTSQGQGDPVVTPHMGAVHPTQQTPGSQGKLGAHLLLGWLKTALTSLNWDLVLSLWLCNNRSEPLQVLR